MHRTLGIGGLCGLFFFGCSNSAGSGGATAEDGGGGGGSSSGVGSSGGITGGSSGGSSGVAAKSLVGTWDLVTSPIGTNGGLATTVTIGQDSLSIASPEFTLTAVRTGSSVAYTDMAPGAIVLTANQTAAAFDTGILPFNLGGTWAMQIVQGGSNVGNCTLSVSATQIDGACTQTPGGPFFTFTSKKMSSAASVLGDFGGKWLNTFVDPKTGTGYPCELDFVGNGITTCTIQDASANANPLQGITFTYDGANLLSGVAGDWAEYSANRR
ncbi:MAG: hypothetical protein ACRENE_12545 [Polyangiaceae bacterium]